MTRTIDCIRTQISKHSEFMETYTKIKSQSKKNFFLIDPIDSKYTLRRNISTISDKANGRNLRSNFILNNSKSQKYSKDTFNSNSKYQSWNMHSNKNPKSQHQTKTSRVSFKNLPIILSSNINPEKPITVEHNKEIQRKENEESNLTSKSRNQLSQSNNSLVYSFNKQTPKNNQSSSRNHSILKSSKYLNTGKDQFLSYDRNTDKDFNQSRSHSTKHLLLESKKLSKFKHPNDFKLDGKGHSTKKVVIVEGHIDDSIQKAYINKFKSLADSASIVGEDSSLNKIRVLQKLSENVDDKEVRHSEIESSELKDHIDNEPRLSKKEYDNLVNKVFNRTLSIRHTDNLVGKKYFHYNDLFRAKASRPNDIEVLHPDLHNMDIMDKMKTIKSKVMFMKGVIDIIYPKVMKARTKLSKIIN